MTGWNLYQVFNPTDPYNILRIICGLFFIPHLFVKFQNQDFVKGFMAKVGLNPPIAWLYASFAIEIVATIGLVFAIYTRYVAILAGVFLLVAAWASWRFSEGKWIWNFGGAEYPLFWAICCFVVAMHG
jgi:putative oxidoreductase